MTIIQESIVNQGHGFFSPTLFAVHSTANPGATAANHRDLWSRGYDYAVHLVSDWNTAYHCVPYDRLCWQVGNGNYTCEGLEICEATNQSDFDKGIQIAAQVVRERLAAHGWGVDRMHSHQWFSNNYGGSDHSDPIPYFQRFGYSWEKFVSLVQNGSNDGNGNNNNNNNQGESLDMFGCIIQIDDDHANYAKGTGCYWSPSTGVIPLPDADCITAINQVSQYYTGKSLPLIHSSHTSPWLIRYQQISAQSPYAPVLTGELRIRDGMKNINSSTVSDSAVDSAISKAISKIKAVTSFNN